MTRVIRTKEAERKIREAFKKHDAWLDMAFKCKHSWQQYYGAPSPLPTCKLIDDACRIENCPKVNVPRKVFSIENCPYGFKRPACEDFCVDYIKCPKEEFRGIYP